MKRTTLSQPSTSAVAVPAIDFAPTGKTAFAAEPHHRADEPGETAREHNDLKAVTVKIGYAELDDGKGLRAIWWPVSGVEHRIEAAYDPQHITLADAETRLRAQLAERGMRVTKFLSEDDEQPEIDPKVTHALAQLEVNKQAARDAGRWSPDCERVLTVLGEMFVEQNDVDSVLEAAFQGLVNDLAAKNNLRLVRVNESANDQLAGEIAVWRDYGLVLVPHSMKASGVLDQLRAALDESRG
ncbi:hypothetical protein [Streptomyces sp. NBC_00271]|uniref:hypothetical protein n=1 Tax=Streptomyces sp. NBC_00271 TaxID=2975697 RepID=UPI002E2CEB0A|nr:hypothetical protein [Streptomyces sp. NBC_00271]